MTSDRPSAGALRHVLIIGHGRSGTNLALDMLDSHPLTICRNEPNEIPGSALAALTGDFETEVACERFLPEWHAALARAAAARGDRDRRGRLHKSYYRSRIAARYVESVLPRGRARRLIAALRPELAGGEWDVTRFHGLAPTGPDCVAVFKLLLRPHWAIQTHATYRGQHVIHVIREPEGFIRSWMNRYVARAEGGPRAVHAANLETIDRILAPFGGRLHFGREFSTDALIETELWRWRFMNELPLRALETSPRYRVWLYDKILAERQAHAEAAMDWLGLQCDSGTRARLQAMTNTLFAKTTQSDIAPARISEIAAGVLEGSPLAETLRTS